MPTARPYTAADLAAVHAVYHDVVVDRVPHCWPVTADDLAAELASPDGFEREETVLRSQQVLVGTDDAGQVQGFVHIGAQAPRKDGAPVRGVLRMLAYRRSARAVGVALLDTAHAWLREHGARNAVAIPQPWRWSFYAYAHAYLSDHLDHVQALLRVAGYRKTGGEVFLDWPEMEPPPAVDESGVDYQLRVEDKPGAGQRPGFRVIAARAGNGVGECEIVSAGEFSRDTAVQDVAFVDWLGVEEAVQGRGLGRYLLFRGLHEARTRGYRHGAISTAVDNDRAFQFYSHHGFQVVDWTYAFTRDL